MQPLATLPILPLLRRERWHGGNLLAFSGLDGVTDFEQGLTGRGAMGGPGIDLKLPAELAIRCPAAAEGPFTVAADWFEFGAAALRCRGVLLDAWHLLLEGPCELPAPPPSALTVLREGARTLIGVAAHFRPELISADFEQCLAQRRHWLATRTPAPGPDARRRALARALCQMKTQVYAPEGRIIHRWTTPDRWPHRRMWLWDSVFHAVGWRHLDAQLAQDAIAAVLDAQAADGFVPHMASPASSSEITQPPVLALGAKLVTDLTGDTAWLRRIYPALCAYVRWDLANRDTDGAGLLEWFIESTPTCRSGESGADNSTRFDAATQLDAVDFNAFLAHECELLADFATRLGLAADAVAWRQRHATLCGLIESRLWSEAAGFYVDYDVTRDQPSPVLAVSGFLPLLCGAASPERAARLVAHLDNPRTFGTAFPIPSVARNDASFGGDMWRGPAWINMNWLVARGLDRYGHAAHAEALRRRTVAEIERWVAAHDSFLEFFDADGVTPPPQLPRKGQCAPERSPYHQTIFDYGWTATLYIDLLATLGEPIL